MNDDQYETLFPLPMWVVIFAFMMCLPSIVFSAPVYVTKAQKGVTVTLHDDPCALKDAVANLPFRATWEEGGQTFEGCWMPRPDTGVIVGFFSDKTAVAISMRVFERVVGI